MIAMANVHHEEDYPLVIKLRHFHVVFCKGSGMRKNVNGQTLVASVSFHAHLLRQFGSIHSSSRFLRTVSCIVVHKALNLDLFCLFHTDFLIQITVMFTHICHRLSSLFPKNALTHRAVDGLMRIIKNLLVI